MRSSKKWMLVAAAMPLVFGLAGCAEKMIGTREGADKIALKTAGEVGQCKSLGRVTVSVMAEVGFITRRPEDVEANLLQMARNSAVDKGGDTVVKGNSTDYGKRTFEVFKCQP